MLKDRFCVWVFAVKNRQAEMPLVCDSCDSPADDPRNQRSNQKRIKINGTPLPCSAEIGGSPPTPPNFSAKNWTNRKEVRINKQQITDSPPWNGRNIRSKINPESWTILRRLSTQVRRRCAHLASRFASIQVFSRSGKVTLTSEKSSRWLVGKKSRDKSHGFFSQIPKSPKNRSELLKFFGFCFDACRFFPHLATRS